MMFMCTWWIKWCNDNVLKRFICGSSSCGVRTTMLLWVVVKCHFDSWLSLCGARMGLGGILTVSYLAYVRPEWTHYMWCEVQ